MLKNKIKNICPAALLMTVCFAIGCNLANKSTVSENKTNRGETAKTENSAALDAGKTQSEAAKILTAAKKKYPKGRILKMRAAITFQHDF